MKSFPTRLTAAIVSVMACTGVATFALLPGAGSAQTHHVDAGMICTESSSDSFVITAQAGRIFMPDGNSVHMWSYSAGSEGFQYPGPILCVTEGDAVTITLRNTLPAPTSIMFEGVEGVLANGAPVSAQVDGAGRLTSFVQSAAPGATITYTFTAPPPGTYLYQSGTDHELQREMGLHGALVVRPAGFTAGNRTVYGDASSSFDEYQEYVHLFSQIDPSIHLAVERGDAAYPIDFSTYRPRYFMINGRSFPDTIAPNNAPWLPNQPYGSLVHLEAIGNGQQLPSVIRYVNASAVSVPFHPHSNSEEIVGIDARRIFQPGDPGDPDNGIPATPDVVASVDRFAVDVQAGQTMDTRFSWTNTTWDANTPNHPVPDQRNLMDGGLWSGDWALGSEGVKPTGGDAFNVCGEYYHVAHNHAIFAATNYGAAMGGQLTLVRVDPLNGC